MDSVKVDTGQEVDAPRGPRKYGKRMARVGDPAKLRGLARRTALARARTLVEQGATLADASRATGLPLDSLNRESSKGGWIKERATLAGIVTKRTGGFDLAGAREVYQAKAVALGQRMLAGLEVLDLTDSATLWEAIPAFATLQRAMAGLLGLGQDGGSGNVTVAGRNVLVLQGDAAKIA